MTPLSYLLKKIKTKKVEKQRQYVYERYCEKLRLEQEFNNINRQYEYVQAYLKQYPNAYVYYYNWLKQMEFEMSKYVPYIDRHDNVSFSTVYGYAKDEDLKTVYRNPLIQNEINIKHRRQQQQQRQQQTYQFYYNPYGLYYNVPITRW